MAILRVRDEQGAVHELLAIRGEKGDAAQVDYTAVAPALKGKKTGNPVVIKDASPLYHEMVLTSDVGGAEVTVYGKNLLTVQNTAVLGKYVTYDPDTQIFTATNDGLIAKLVTFNEPLPVGTVVSITLQVMSGRTTKKGFAVGGYHTAGEGEISNEWQGTVEAEWGVDLAGKTYTATFTATKTVDSIVLYLDGSMTVEEPLVFKAQFEIGSRTDYEPYREPWTLAGSDEGKYSRIVMRDGQGMTLFADSGTLTATYNRDLNKVIAAIEEAMG